MPCNFLRVTDSGLYRAKVLHVLAGLVDQVKDFDAQLRHQIWFSGAGERSWEVWLGPTGQKVHLVFRFGPKSRESGIRDN